MTDRRSFIKTLAAGGVLLTFRPLSLLSYQYSPVPGPVAGLAGLADPKDAVWYGESSLPLWKDVDVVVVGASSGAVAAAVAAASQGVRVFVASTAPYAGEDICGSFLYWPKRHESASELFGKVFPSTIAPLPLHVKSTLENEMIDKNVDFLYSSQFAGLIVDSEGTPSGICIANRSGIQAIRAKVIIDATPRALVARAAGASFHPFKAGRHRFVHTVVGNELRKDSRIASAEEIFPAFNTETKSFKVIRYGIDVQLDDDSYSSIMEAEQTVRDITWDVEQGDSCDVPWMIPSSFMDSRDAFAPNGIKGIYVLGPSSAVARESVEDWLEPATLMENGEKLGRTAAREAASRKTPEGLQILPSLKDGGRMGEIHQSGGVRPFAPLASVAVRKGALPVLATCDVLVVGGGTAGAPAAISAGRNGSRVILLEYLHGLGGIGTFGFIGRYTAGYRKGFTAEMDQALQKIAPAGHPRHVNKTCSEWAVDWKAEWYREEARKAGVEMWYHSTVCGCVREGNRVSGVLVCTPWGFGIVKGGVVVDSTGSADVAIAAGAGFGYTGSRSLAVQGAGLPKFAPCDHYNNTDWTFVDDSDIEDVTRLFIQVKVKNQGCYDVGKLPQTRERRRIISDYNVSVFDMMNRKTYCDTVSFHISNFDTHGYTEDIFFTVNPPDKGGTHYEVKLPLRALLPAGLEGIIVTGLGAGVHRDAMPVVRMQPDLQNQGYAAGLVASEAVKAGAKLRELDIRPIQKRLVEKGNLPAEVLGETDSPQVSDKALQEAVAKLPEGYSGLEVVLSAAERAVPMLEKALRKAAPEQKIYFANVLCMLGGKAGAKTVLSEVKSCEDWDKGWNYRGMHQFGFSVSRLDNYIMALGNCRCTDAVPELLRLASKVTSTTELSHVRALCTALEQIGSASAVPALKRILSLEGMTGYHIADHLDSTRKIRLNVIDGVYILENSLRNSALKELFLARSLYWCGERGGVGEKILRNYSSGLEAHYARFAWESLLLNK